MTIWPPAPGSLGRPAYRALAQSVVDAVSAGELKPGTRLPPHRTLAFDLGVSVQTVSRAYEELARLGIVSGEVGRGSFVRAPGSDAHTPWHRIDGSERTIDFSMLTPVRSKAHAKRFAATLMEIAADPPEEMIFSFRPTATLAGHCEIAVRWLSRCGVTTHADRVLPTNGNTSAMTVALMTAAAPGDLIATEAMGHHTLKALTASLGLRLSGLPVDEQGMLPDALDQACRMGAVRAIYLMPDGLNPLAFVMSEDRRRALVEVARRRDLSIIENAAWGPLMPDRPPPFATLAPERTFYFTGLTKCCLPGLRIAWLIAPDRMAAAVRTRHLVTNWMATPLVAEVASRWLADGTAAELVRWQRAAFGERNIVVRRILAGHDIGGTANGLHVWFPLPPSWDEMAFVSLARHAGVAVAGGSAFAMTADPQHRGVRICLGAANEADLARGLRTVVQLADSEPQPAHLAY